MLGLDPGALVHRDGGGARLSWGPVEVTLLASAVGYGRFRAKVAVMVFLEMSGARIVLAEVFSGCWVPTAGGIGAEQRVAVLARCGTEVEVAVVLVRARIGTVVVVVTGRLGPGDVDVVVDPPGVGGGGGEEKEREASLCDAEHCDF